MRVGGGAAHSTSFLRFSPVPTVPTISGSLGGGERGGGWRRVFEPNFRKLFPPDFPHARRNQSRGLGEPRGVEGGMEGRCCRGRPTQQVPL
jgi:hypothetical protein